MVLVACLTARVCNVTGVSFLAPELVGKRLELLKQAVPGVRRVAVLWPPGDVPERTAKDLLKGAELAARALGLRLQLVEARGPADFDLAFSEMTTERADALSVLARRRGDAPPGLRPAIDSLWRAGLARDVLHDGDGALAHERNGHRVGAHTVARDAAGGLGGATTGQRGRLGRLRMTPTPR